MPPDPTILAFDTSTAHCAVAVLLGGRIVVDRLEPMAKGQAERLLPLCGEALAEAQLDWEDLDAIGVCVGPGNFTGVRIGVSAARGMALGLSAPAIGISALEALSDGTPGRAVIDARQGRCYTQVFGQGDATKPEVIEASALSQASHPIFCRSNDPLAQPEWQTRPRLAPAVARLAASRIGASEAQRPAPLYLRAPDAKPSSVQPPVLL